MRGSRGHCPLKYPPMTNCTIGITDASIADLNSNSLFRIAICQSKQNLH